MSIITQNKSGYKRLPRHIGIIPDGNRRWAQEHNMPKWAGYDYGINPGFQLYDACLDLGIEEITFYGFTQDNTKRPVKQRESFQKACVDAVMGLTRKNAQLLVIGNTRSPLFPKELLPYTNRKVIGEGAIKINFLVNYGWQWDLNGVIEAMMNKDKLKRSYSLNDHIVSKDISRLDLIIRWGGRRRLSGFLPVQSIYADFYVVDEFWPDFKIQHLYDALSWYDKQDVTLGG